MSVAVRAATAADEPAVLALLEELFDPPGWRPPGYSRERGAIGFHHAVADPDGDVLLAVEDGAIVGLASVYVLHPSMRFARRCWLEDLVVTASRRSWGIGRVLLDAATAWARARDVTELELSSAASRRDAHRFYVANGMSPSQKFTRPIRD